MVTGKDQEVYLNNKIDGILDNKFSSIVSSQNSSVQSPRAQSVDIKQILNSPTRSFGKTKEMQKAINRGSMINTSSSISVPITPNKNKKDEISR